MSHAWIRIRGIDSHRWREGKRERERERERAVFRGIAVRTAQLNDASSREIAMPARTLPANRNNLTVLHGADLLAVFAASSVRPAACEIPYFLPNDIGPLLYGRVV